MTTLSTTLISDILTDHFKTPSIYLALFTTIPTGGVAGTEVVGGSYARQDVTFGAISNGLMSNTSELSFPTMPAVVVRAGGLYTAVSGGTFLIGGPFSSPRTVIVGRTFNVEIGDLVMRVRP